MGDCPRTLHRAELYRADGVHLSDEGNDIFLHDLHVGLREFSQVGGGRKPKPRLGPLLWQESAQWRGTVNTLTPFG